MNTFVVSSARRAKLLVAVLLTPLALLSLAGCGGNGDDAPAAATRGRMTLRVVWPEGTPSRVIPTNAQSLLVQVKRGGVIVDSGLIVRPAETLTFASLPVGALSFAVSAYASPGGTGTALATATVPATILPNATSNINVTLASTIDHLEATPNPFTLGAGLSAPLSVVARDANGDVVLLAPNTLSFTFNNSAVVAVSAAGVATAGASVGSATIVISEGDSGKTLSLPVTVVPTVTVTPETSTLTLRDTQTFVATVVGPTDTSVIWSVQEGSAGGTVNPAGLYTAPATGGTYHVVATSAADPSRKAIATVTVTSGSAGLTVH